MNINTTIVFPLNMTLLRRIETMGLKISDITDLGKFGNLVLFHSMLLEPTINYNILLKFREKKANPYCN